MNQVAHAAKPLQTWKWLLVAAAVRLIAIFACDSMRLRLAIICFADKSLGKLSGSCIHVHFLPCFLAKNKKNTFFSSLLHLQKWKAR